MSINDNLLRMLQVAREVSSTFNHTHTSVEVSEVKRSEKTLDIQPLFNNRGPSRYEVVAFTTKLKLAVKKQQDSSCSINLMEQADGVCFVRISIND